MRSYRRTKKISFLGLGICSRMDDVPDRGRNERWECSAPRGK